jgi:2-polyprenyl-3-methyl-5-hydroxy-6-metoxy-1,4-benzoquinol methylase
VSNVGTVRNDTQRARSNVAKRVPRLPHGHRANPRAQVGDDEFTFCENGPMSGGRSVSVDTDKLTRFAFGKNWRSYLSLVDEPRIAEARRSLQAMFGTENMTGKRFLDIGSGSGLFSLAARRMGAATRSFDFDPDSVSCAEELRRRYETDHRQWIIERGSALDAGYLETLGSFDFVYCWGVLHHTGDMWRALAHIIPLVDKNGGKLYIAIYNDQGWISRYWTYVKRMYNQDRVSRTLVTLIHVPYLFLARWLVRAIKGRLELDRGMSLWHDMHDWLGGYPFEVAKPEAVFDFLRANGFVLTKLRTCGGRHGCNEFVFTTA